MHNQSIGLLGGTFDPIHFGHLRAAIEIKERLSLDEIRLIPCRCPPHRVMPSTQAQHRLNMARLAVAGSSLLLDEREMHREGPSYSVDTLMSFRQEFPEASINLVIGLDAFMGLQSWYQWEKLLQLANIIVMCRKGWSLQSESPMVELMKKHAPHKPKDIRTFQSGYIIEQTITSLEISASIIRSYFEQGLDPRFLLPENVLKYIQKNALYGYNGGNIKRSNEEV